MEGSLMPIAIGISRAIGLCNLRYMPELKRFELDHGAMMVYWLFLDVVYLVLTPTTFIVMVHSFFSCQDMDMLAVAFSAVALAKGCSMLVMLASIWLRRRRVQRLGNGLLALVERYPRYHDYSFWRRHSWKLFLGTARFVVLIHQLFGPGSALMCGEDDEIVTKVPPTYIVLAVATLLMELALSCSDTLIYFLLATSNRLLECMSQELLELAQDVRWLPSSHGCHRSVYQRQLLAAWRRLWRSCLRLDCLLQQLLQIFQLQMLLNLFTNYLIDITIIFNLVVYFADAEYISKWRIIFYFVICISYHFDIMMHFSIFGTNHQQWMRLSARLQRLWFALKPLNIDWQDTHAMAMLRQVEFAVIFLNRKQQRRPERMRRLQVVGLFELNRSSWNSMNSSIATNVLILCQIAYKIYY
ncbi:putative gustatory receptor 58c [Drosophila virilis]|uniref:Gustatory receptor n=1 Tax=Drosophila virilis TaxID=7244 RepID=B4LNC6_DROVI|nr:putative gustatory receptor 58c [Drosophila virilis]EDW61078.1 uncharacterized protein Dvir_GJ21839 [Drosophila virilis]